MTRRLCCACWTAVLVIFDYGKLGLPIAAKGVLASIIPDVATAATKAAQFHIIDMRGAAVLEYEDEFML